MSVNNKDQDAESKTNDHNPDEVLVLGVDFGTTFSGVAWAVASEPDLITTRMDYPDSDLMSSNPHKTASHISYSCFGNRQRWGSVITAAEGPLKLFKLLLLDDTDLPDYIRDKSDLIETKKRIQEMGKSAAEVVYDYLTVLLANASKQISKTYHAQPFQTVQKRIVATLPAIWPIYAQVRMREAVLKAAVKSGIFRQEGDEKFLTIISEHEAAALATVHDLMGQNSLKVGDCFVVCDAGGGTVDLITYHVLSTHPMTVEEGIQGEGDFCGALLLDEGFLDVMRNTMSRKTWREAQKGHRIDSLHAAWEYKIKPSFDEQTSRYSILCPPAKGGYHTLSRDQLRPMFEDVAARVTALVNQQITKAEQKYSKRPKCVYMVGGLGCNNFLHKYIQREMGEDIKVLKDAGIKPITAVLRGAVLRGIAQETRPGLLTADITSRISRVSYGIVVNAFPFEEDKHDPIDRVWFPLRNTHAAQNQVTWLIRNGQPVSNEGMVHAFVREWSPDPVVVDIVYSEAESPLLPSRCTEAVKRFCRLEWSALPDEKSVPLCAGDGRATYRELKYEVHITADQAAWLDFAIYYEGERVAYKKVAGGVDFSGASILLPKITTSS